MRELYMYKKDVKAILNPHKSFNGMTELKHPERLLNNSTKLIKYPSNYYWNTKSGISDIHDMFSDRAKTPIICNLLLTDKTHNGIWLMRDDDNNRLTIPQAIICEDRLEDIQMDRCLRAIYGSIIDSLINRSSVLDESIISIFDGYNFDTLEYVLKQQQFSLLNNSFPMYYNFYSQFNNELNLFVIKEVEPIGFSVNDIAPLLNYEFNDYVWYSRKDHVYNTRTSKDRKSLFSYKYKYDVRIEDSGIELLDIIFNTENIFGKLNIY